MSYFAKLKDLRDLGRLSVILIVAPPRTNSSLIEHVLGNSASVHSECHEPFFGAGRTGFETDRSYQIIYESIGSRTLDRKEKRFTIVVKEIAQWISVGEEYKNLFALVDEPVIVVIRNPLLAVESRIRKVLETLREEVLGESIGRKAHPHELDDLPTVIERDALFKHDYRRFGELLHSSSVSWAKEDLDFVHCATQVEFMRNQKIPHFILETTDLRASPVRVLQKLCAAIRIKYSEAMLTWPPRSVDYHTSQKTKSSAKWYRNLQESTGIRPPTEIPAPLSAFPEFIRKYLREKSLPAYLNLATRKHTPKDIMDSLNQLAFTVSTPIDQAERLSKLGVVIDPLTSRDESKVELQYIDPVYAITNAPNLLDDTIFAMRKHAYSEELDVARGILK